ncbi:MAG: type II toxin-antitoxin system prevent-host-death family antitoxin [Betaproteobacteria bacterium]
MHEARTHLSRLIERVRAGEEVVIAKAGKPVARLVPVLPAGVVRKPGSLKGRIRIGPDFTAPPLDEVIALFEGRPVRR